MSNAAKHRKKAAEFEQLKQIDRAISAYISSIEESESAGEDVDVALFNKVGDLALRQGRVPDAITYYERAVEHYATSGLFNNAIALCNKILRSAPGRANVYFTLGRVCARKGLRGDATRNFLEYATRMKEEGRVDEGMRALAEIVDLSPELTEIRKLVDDYALRAGISLPRRLTPSVVAAIPGHADLAASRHAKSNDLVFLQVDYGRKGSTPPRSTRSRTPSRTPLRVRPQTPIDTPAQAQTPPGDSEAIDPLAAAIIEPGPAWGSLEAAIIEPGPGLGLLRAYAAAEAEAEAEAAAARDAGDVDGADDAPAHDMLAGLDVFPDTTIALTDENTVESTIDSLNDAVIEPPKLELVSTELDVAALSTIELLDEVETEDYAHADQDPVIARIIQTETPLANDAITVDPAPLPTVANEGLATHGLPVESIPTVSIDRIMAAMMDTDIEHLEIEPVAELDDAIAAGQQAAAAGEGIGEAVVGGLGDTEPLAGLVSAAPAFEPTVELPMIDLDLPPVVTHIITPIKLQFNLGGTKEPPRAERPPFRLDPHDFILSGELPPLVLEDGVVNLGFDRATHQATPTSVSEIPAPVDATFADVARIDPADAVEAAFASAEGAGAPPPAKPVLLTAVLPIADVAAEATIVASSRRDALRASVERLPRNWMLRRRLAEALLEAGEREAALGELETARQGLIDDGDLAGAADIGDELVNVSPERVPFHQRRVELAVRMHDLQRLRMAYLDLADALVRLGEDGRARAVYARVLEIDPHDDRARTALGSAAPPPPPPVVRPDDEYVDLSTWLKDEDGPSGDSRLRMREPVISGDEQADFAELLRHFKEGVARSLGEDDFESHYDLGVAYKEMGLLDDAIAEFQKALRSHGSRLPAYEALGQCFVEQERYQVAVTVLSRALHEPGITDQQRVGVLYLLAISCEALQRFDEARSYLQRVHATDIDFRDVAARLAALELVAR